MSNDTLSAFEVPVSAWLLNAQASEGFPPRDHTVLLSALGTGAGKNIEMMEKNQSKGGAARIQNRIGMETFWGGGWVGEKRKVELERVRGIKFLPCHFSPK